MAKYRVDVSVDYRTVDTDLYTTVVDADNEADALYMAENEAYDEYDVLDVMITKIEKVEDGD